MLVGIKHLTTKILIIALLTLLSSGIVYSQTDLQYFTAKSDKDAILLEWKTGIENNLKHFEIERSASDQNNFIAIGSINSNGNNSYYFFSDELRILDNSIYYYRLKLVNHDNTFTYSNVVSVTHIISSIRSTWGSIKAIFR